MLGSINSSPQATPASLWLGVLLARTLKLEDLVCMKLTSNRRKDQVHILDMISIGMIDESWLELYSPVLRERLQQLLNDPEG
jgi:hypothetical protein